MKLKWNYKQQHKTQSVLPRLAEFIVKLFLIMMFTLIYQYAFAGDDPLAGTELGLTSTLGSGGSGRKYLYLVEGIVGTAAYIKTKNLLTLGGVIAIEIFLNILFKIARISN